MILSVVGNSLSLLFLGTVMISLASKSITSLAIVAFIGDLGGDN